MNASPSSRPANRASKELELIELWAANLALPDVKLAPFMPARIALAAGAPPPDRELARLLRLIACAQGKGAAIIL